MYESRREKLITPTSGPRPYSQAMTVSAHDIAAVLRQRLANIGQVKLHKLLYYCQAHHLAAFDEPLFTEQIYAWDMGPVVSKLWKDEEQGRRAPVDPTLGEAELNTVGYVLSRYGALTGEDLRHMTHAEAPWQLANASRQPGDSAKIRREWMTAYFRTDGAPDDDAGDMPLDSGAVRTMIRDAGPKGDDRPRHADSLDDIQAWAERNAS